MKKMWKYFKLFIRYNLYYNLKYKPLKLFSKLIFKYNLSDTTSKIKYNQKISTIVFQTWISKKFNLSHYLGLQMFRKLNPELSFKLYNDKRMDSYMRRRWSEHKIYEVYKKSIFGPLRTDIFRYCILYDKGGYYFDIDKMCKKKLIDLHSPSASALLTFEPYFYKKENNKKVSRFLKMKNRYICQWGMGFQKKHPLLNILINKICQKYLVIKNKTFENYFNAGSYFTGPAMFTETVREFLRNKIDKNICFLKTNFNNNGIFRIKGSHLRYVLLRPSWTYKNCKLAN